MILETVSDGELGMILVMSLAIIGGAFAIMRKAKLNARLRQYRENKDKKQESD
jgi:F0F1-type ATP synthase assembly protein I